MKKMISIIIFSFLFSSSVEFNISTDRTDVFRGEYIKLLIDINIDKGYFIYSTDPEKSLSPTRIIWPDSTIFIDSSIFFEPEPKIKFDPNFEMEVSYHTGHVKLNQYFFQENLIVPAYWVYLLTLYLQKIFCGYSSSQLLYLLYLEYRLDA